MAQQRQLLHITKHAIWHIGMCIRLEKKQMPQQFAFQDCVVRLESILELKKHEVLCFMLRTFPDEI